MVAGAFGGGTFQPKFAGGAFTCRGAGPSVGPADGMLGAGADPAGRPGADPAGCGARAGGGALVSIVQALPWLEVDILGGGPFGAGR